MPLPFSCPNCGLETLVDDEFAGSSGPCAGCGKTITVPLLTDAAAREHQVAATPLVASPRSVTLVVVLSILAASIVFLLLVMVVSPSFHIVWGTVYRAQCRSNLSKIAAALKQYEMEHGSLPPAYIADANGKPMHSWRVLILPQLDEQGLYQRYDFSEPWDGPNNSRPVSMMPGVFACPADPAAQAAGETNYMVLVGPKTLFPGRKALRTADVADDPATTILVIETPAAGIVWMEPKDLTASRMQFSINSGSPGEIGSSHSDGAHGVMVDGSVHYFHHFFAPDYLEGMSTPQGGEDIPVGALP